MRSFLSRLMPAVVTLRGSKRHYSTAARTAARVDGVRRNPVDPSPPARLRRHVRIERTEQSGWPVYEVSPKIETKIETGMPDAAAVYFHGGAYIYEITSHHWNMIARLTNSTGTTFFVPIYPLAPMATAERTVSTATAVASGIISRFGPSNVTILGDSAGGGMALAVSQQLRVLGVARHRRTILISPWLDISMTDPLIAALAPWDPWLGAPGAREAGRMYRGSLDEHDPRVSPLFGDLADIAPITMFSGTRDIAHADARSLIRVAEAAGIGIDYHEAPGMLHVYPILPIPEGRQALDVMRRLLIP